MAIRNVEKFVAEQIVKPYEDGFFENQTAGERKAGFKRIKKNPEEAMERLRKDKDLFVRVFARLVGFNWHFYKYLSHPIAAEIDSITKEIRNACESEFGEETLIPVDEWTATALKNAGKVYDRHYDSRFDYSLFTKEKYDYFFYKAMNKIDSGEMEAVFPCRDGNRYEAEIRVTPLGRTYWALDFRIFDNVEEAYTEAGGRYVNDLSFELASYMQFKFDAIEAIEKSYEEMRG